MTITNKTAIRLVPAAGLGEDVDMTWGEFIAANPDLKPDDLEAIRSALENDNAYQHSPGRGAPVVYIRKA